MLPDTCDVPTVIFSPSCLPHTSTYQNPPAPHALRQAAHFPRSCPAGRAPHQPGHASSLRQYGDHLSWQEICHPCACRPRALPPAGHHNPGFRRGILLAALRDIVKVVVSRFRSPSATEPNRFRHANTPPAPVFPRIPFQLNTLPLACRPSAPPLRHYRTPKLAAKECLLWHRMKMPNPLLPEADRPPLSVTRKTGDSARLAYPPPSGAAISRGRSRFILLPSSAGGPACQAAYAATF